MCIRVGGTFAQVIVIKALLSVIKAADGIKVFCMVTAYLRGNSLVVRRYHRVIARLHAGLKEERGVGSHLVMVSVDVGHPAVESFHAPHALGVLEHQVVTIQVKPVVVGTSSGPYFIELTT